METEDSEAFGPEHRLGVEPPCAKRAAWRHASVDDCDAREASAQVGGRGASTIRGERGLAARMIDAMRGRDDEGTVFCA